MNIDTSVVPVELLGMKFHGLPIKNLFNFVIPLCIIFFDFHLRGSQPQMKKHEIMKSCKTFLRSTSES